MQWWENDDVVSWVEAGGAALGGLGAVVAAIYAAKAARTAERTTRAAQLGHVRALRPILVAGPTTGEPKGVDPTDSVAVATAQCPITIAVSNQSIHPVRDVRAEVTFSAGQVGKGTVGDLAGIGPSTADPARSSVDAVELSSYGEAPCTDYDSILRAVARIVLTCLDQDRVARWTIVFEQRTLTAGGFGFFEVAVDFELQ